MKENPFGYLKEKRRTKGHKLLAPILKQSCTQVRSQEWLSR
jgi:hypothetical protein